MSARPRSPLATAARRRAQAPVFAALGDETRLSLVARLCSGSPLSIARLTAGSDVTRQAITKHLRVLERAGIVCGVRDGRQNLFELQPRALGEARRYLDGVSAEWERALARLKSFVED
jgi:DNA-binding transcriptional ArsR family regulator